MLSACY